MLIYNAKMTGQQVEIVNEVTTTTKQVIKVGNQAISADTVPVQPKMDYEAFVISKLVEPADWEELEDDTCTPIKWKHDYRSTVI